MCIFSNHELIWDFVSLQNFTVDDTGVRPGGVVSDVVVVLCDFVDARQQRADQMKRNYVRVD